MGGGRPNSYDAEPNTITPEPTFKGVSGLSPPRLSQILSGIRKPRSNSKVFVVEVVPVRKVCGG